MDDKRNVKVSKFLSLVLRHEPETAGISLDTNGWVTVEQLLDGCNKKGFAISLGELQEVVATNSKKRFSFNADGTKIRANQGHSVEVDLDYKSMVPPAQLFHGTATRFLDSIRAQGLLKQQRHHVHLSAEFETALKVGQRHGKPLVLTVKSGEMHAEGIVFYQSANGVWLTETVAARFLIFPESE
jgi:putative RNA 2'-phosphotransferase